MRGHDCGHAWPCGAQPKRRAIVPAMDARSGKIALAVAVLASGLVWASAPACSTNGPAYSCNLDCGPKESCCTRAKVLDGRLPDGGPQPIPDGGHAPGDVVPACLHTVVVGNQAEAVLPSGQPAVCVDQL